MTEIFHTKKTNTSGLPRLMIMGHGRHGKDTVAEILERLYGMKFVSSSWKCAEKVICAILSDEVMEKQFLDWLPETDRRRMKHSIQNYNMRWAEYHHGTHQTPPMGFVDWAFSVRSDYRELWYLAIGWYNFEDPTLLCREIMDVADCYVGIRDAREFTAIWNSGLLDAAVWVDASRRLGPEDASSISIQPHMASHHIDNNGTLAQLETAVKQFMWGQFGMKPNGDG